jgi:hypothetical protein
MAMAMAMHDVLVMRVTVRTPEDRLLSIPNARQSDYQLSLCEHQRQEQFERSVGSSVSMSKVHNKPLPDRAPIDRSSVADVRWNWLNGSDMRPF